MDPRQELAHSTASVRSDLERIRLETQREIDRLNRELLEHLEAADRLVDSATDQLALEQEADRLRLTLHEREESLDAITAECRRLEDQLEDQNLAYDGLRQELTRKLDALANARSQVDQLQAELERLKAGDRSGWINPRKDAAEEDGAAPTPRPRRGKRIAVLGPALVFIAVAGALLWWRQASLPGQPQATPPSVSAPAEDEGPSQGEPDQSASSEQQIRPAVEPVVVLSKTRDRLRNGSAGPLMIELSGGRFTMGRDTPDAPDASPAHEVHVPAFLIGAYEVTFAEYDLFARATGRRTPDDFGWGRGRRPVVDVSWFEARAYAQWLSRQTGEVYRLPTEAEWEMAARGGVESSYWWGGYPESNRAACFDCGSRWDNRLTAPIATFPPNPYGLYDTAGNVAEWVADCYHPSYRGAPSDGRAWDAQPCEFRVMRGGAFSRPASSMRSFARGRLAPTTRLNMLGFRVARER